MQRSKWEAWGWFFLIILFLELVLGGVVGAGEVFIELSKGLAIVP